MFQKIKIRKMTISRALDKYLKTVSIHKKGHLQEFYRVNVIKRHPIAERYMDDITTVDIANYRDQRLAQINPRTGRQITGNTVRLELALLSSLFNIARVEWGTCRMNPVELHLPTTKNGAPRDVPLSRKARNYLQMLPTQLNGNIFSYTSSGFKSAWRTALQELKIENLHFHDLRHEAISRFFELGTLNVIEVAAISGHRSLNMLKRYTHLRAYQLVSKLDARRKQTSKIAPYFVPYPATVENRNGQVVVTLSDFDLEISAATKEQAIFHASVLLLRTLAQAAQRGERVPTPGELPTNIDERVMICPLTN
ncbi:site-specific integrase [Escherichia coli]|uniref:site-specific integrase n=1 Tax=Escherichia coli TaxID=562 RepID=UPI00254367E0|nr:site-specific integrase [Escherichia coli]